MDENTSRKRKLLSDDEESDKRTKSSADDLHQSFMNTWPTNAQKTAEEMIEAGFFATGQQDEVQCHECHVKKKEWKVSDDVWYVHARLEPKCKFVLEIKGAEFSHKASKVVLNVEKYRKRLLEERQMNDRPLFRRIKKFTLEKDRVASFENWPFSDIYKPEELAKLGFYYTGKDDYIKCFYCRNVFYDWRNTEDDPASEHARYQPNCPFNRHLKGNEFIEGIKMKWRNLYDSEEKRVQSFDEWPTSSSKAPKDLAKAGFFYTGTRDITQCFECGVTVYNWSIYTDPWFLHAAVRPTCEFVRRVKGETFVDLVGKMLLTKKKKLLKKRSKPKMKVNSDDSFQSINDEHDDEIQNLMNSITVQTVLESGFDELSIKIFLRDRLENGEMFETPEQLFPALVESQQQDSDVFDILQHLKKDDERLQESKICTICERRQGPHFMFIPCGHLHSCCICHKNLKLCTACGAEPQLKLKFFAE